MSRGRARGRKPTGASREPRRSGGHGTGNERTAPAAHGLARGFDPVLLSAVLAIALYLPTLAHGFVWDDHTLIEGNRLMKSADGLGRLMVSDFWVGGSASGLWRPWISFTYWLDSRFTGPSPAWMHGVNLLSHAGASALVALLALRGGASRFAAAIAGLWFAAMPLHVESVAWISGRTDLHAAVFLLATLALDRRSRARGAAWTGVLPLLALTLALLSKEVAIACLGVIAVMEWTEPAARRSLASSAAWLAPYAAVSALYALAHTMVVHTPAASGVLVRGARGQGLDAALAMIPGYLAFLWPGFPHSPAAMLHVPEAGSITVILAGAVSLAVLAAFGIALARRAPEARPLAVFLFTLLPVVVVNLAQGTLIFGERYFYLPSAGVAWLLGMLLTRMRRPRPAWVLGALSAAWIAANAVMTLRGTPVWASDDTLFQSMTVLHPSNYSARIRWAQRLLERGDGPGAAREVENAARLEPARPEAYGMRAQLHAARAEWKEAAEQAERAIAMGFAPIETRQVRVVALLALGRLAEARQEVEALRRGRPASAALEALWGQYLIADRQPLEALSVLERAERIFPGNADLTYTRGLAAVDAGRAAEAIQAFRRTVELEPSRYNAWLQIAIASSMSGDADGARRALAAAGRLPQSADGRVRELERMIGPRSP